MKKIIRLTESDLARIIKRVIKEQGPYAPGMGPNEKTPPGVNPTVQKPNLKPIEDKKMYPKEWLDTFTMLKNLGFTENNITKRQPSDFNSVKLTSRWVNRKGKSEVVVELNEETDDSAIQIKKCKMQKGEIEDTHRGLSDSTACYNRLTYDDPYAGAPDTTPVNVYGPMRFKCKKNIESFLKRCIAFNPQIKYVRQYN